MQEEDISFSAHQRPVVIDRLRREFFDLLVIGGGITGAGIALDATLRGLRTALIEKDDFAFGTSSRSTKLIHGGLRYLKQLEFGLVKEVGSERAIVHALAPHLVIPEKMLLPLYEKRGFGSLLTSMGLKLYDWLAGVKPQDQRRMLTRKQTLKAEPLLDAHDIKGGALYAEYRTDDARLTVELIKKAFLQGVAAVNYVEAVGFRHVDSNVQGVHAVDRETQTKFPIQAAVVVNATGPWVDDLRELNASRNGKTLHLTKGVHVVVPHEKLPVKQSIYFDVGDGRMIFAIPRGLKTYVGTTDTNYTGSKEDVFADQQDVDYLVKAVNATFPSTSITPADIESTWAGLRPLIHEEGKSASELSRKDEIFVSHTGLISIAGGKLTGYRKMAERVVDLVIERAFEDRSLNPCSTAAVQLTTAPFHDSREVAAFVDELKTLAQQKQLPIYLAPYLAYNYGKVAKDLVLASENGKPDTLVRLECRYAIQHEMAVKVLDFLVRRTGMLFFDKDRMDRCLEIVISEFAELLKWSSERVLAERESVKRYAEMTLQFKA